MKNHVTMKDLQAGMCKWPFGDPREIDFHFCGKARGAETSYCPRHMDIAHAAARRSSTSKHQ